MTTLTPELVFFQSDRPSSLLKRFVTIDEIAALVTYVASELSSATNGAPLRADGGAVRAILQAAVAKRKSAVDTRHAELQ